MLDQPHCDETVESDVMSDLAKHTVNETCRLSTNPVKEGSKYVQIPVALPIVILNYELPMTAVDISNKNNNNQ